MSWGAFWLFYQCESCGQKFREDLANIGDEDFGRCRTCQVPAKNVGDSADMEGLDLEDYPQVP